MRFVQYAGPFLGGMVALRPGCCAAVKAQEARPATPHSEYRAEVAGAAGKRVALVIGNAEYKNTSKLDNPKNDATDIAVVLKQSLSSDRRP